MRKEDLKTTYVALLLGGSLFLYPTFIPEVVAADAEDGVVNSFEELWNPTPAQLEVARSVSIRGQVLYYDHRWGMLWINDGQTGGYVNAVDTAFPMQAGDWINLRSKTHPGALTLDMGATMVSVDVPGVLPEPIKIKESELTESVHNNRFVQIEGYVRSVAEVDEHLELEVVVGEQLVDAFIILESGDTIPAIVETVMRLDGVIAVPRISPESPARPSVYANSLNQVRVISGAVNARFGRSPVSVLALETLQGSQEVVFEGVVEEYERGTSMVVRDSTGVIAFPVWQTRDLMLGVAVQVAGRIEEADGKNVLRDAVFRDVISLGDEPNLNPWNLPIERIDSLRRTVANSDTNEGYVRLGGTVTGVETDGQRSIYYLQDGTGAVRLRAERDHIPVSPQTWIDVVVQVVQEGNERFVELLRVIRRSPSRYPIPEQVRLSPVAYRQFSDRFSELVGLVTAVEPGEGDNLHLQIQNSRGVLEVICQRTQGLEAADWLESIVSVCGVCRQTENATTGKMEGEMLVADPSLVKVQRQGQEDPFASEPITVSELVQVGPQQLGARAVIRGFVTHRRRAGEIYVADRTGGIMVRLRGAETLDEGDAVEVSGFPTWEGDQLALLRSLIRQPEVSVDVPSPLPISRFENPQPHLVGMPVVVQGEVVSFDQSGRPPTLKLLMTDAVVPIELPSGELALDPESIVSLEAVYLASFDEFGVATRPRLVVSDISDITVLKAAPLFSSGQLFTVTGVGGLALLLTWFWNASLRRRVASQTKAIREQHRKERVIKERFQTLVESSDDLILTCSRGGSVQTFSAAGDALFGYTEEMISGHKLDELFVASNPEVLQLLNDYTGKLTAGESFQLLFQRADGTSFWGDLRLKEIPDWHGAPVVLGVVRDVSQRKAMEDELERAKDAAESADRAKSEFLANMSHEIRTPMNGVIGMAELLMEGSLNKDQKGFVETIRTSGETLIRVINDILDFSKLDAGRVSLELQPFNPRQMFEHIVDSLDREAMNKDLYLDLYLPPNLPRVVVADEVRLRQVFWNLLGNAVKFTREGGVRISVRVDHSELEEQARFEVEIRDTGIGMSEEQIGCVFQPFSQGDPSTTRRFGGTGLGLAICQQLVQAMNGEIRVQSELKQGSLFVVSVALSVAESAEESDIQPSTGTHVALLVSGDGTTDSSIVQYLTDFDYDVQTVESDEELAKRISLLSSEQGQVLCVWPQDRAVAKGSDLESVYGPVGESKWIKTVILQRRTGALDDHELDSRFSWLRYPIRLGELREILLPKEMADAQTPTSNREALPKLESRPLDILVAEDSLLNRKVIAAQLKRLGHRPVVVEDGQALLDLIDRTVYDVILMDCQMPRVDGFEATRRLRSTSAHRDAPIVALTAAAREEDREQCLAAGMTDFISKPVVIERLQEVLAKATRHPGT